MAEAVGEHDADQESAKRQAGIGQHRGQEAQCAAKALAAVEGARCRGRLRAFARGEVVSRVWDYIKKNNLQNPENKREILADAKLEPVFGKKKVTMFEMNKHLAQNLFE